MTSNYKIEQYSLSSYKITNIGDSLYCELYKYNESNLEFLSTIIIATDEDSTINLSEDGLYVLKLKLTNTVEYLATYVIHNIMAILNKRQTYLTNLLQNINIEKCQAFEFYDYISFNVLFNTYIYMTEHLILGSTVNDYINVVPTVIPNNLYEIENVYNQLMEYC